MKPVQHNSGGIAIQVNNISKCYQIYEKPSDRLRQFFLPRLRRYIGLSPKQYYREFWALRDVSFEVKRGEAVGIIGRNGAGKSTLLQIIAGTLAPTSGDIQVNGTVAALLELGSGFNLEFSGRENVYLTASVLGLTQNQIEQRFDEIAAFADIGDFIEQPLNTYSSGMMMRLAFAVNTCINPDILIVDEALGVGDAPFQAKCFKRLKRLQEDGTSLLFVSHDLSTVRGVCSRALWLDQGTQRVFSSAQAVSTDYERFCWEEQGINIFAEAKETTSSLEDMLPDEPGNDSNFQCDAAPENGFTPLSSSTRYGNQKVEIINFYVTDEYGNVLTRCSYDQLLTFNFVLRANADINSDMTIGGLFRDIKGVEIMAATTIGKPYHLSMSVGQVLLIKGNLKVPLTHQEYIIQIGVFGFHGGNKYVDQQYDFSRADIWDGFDQALVFTVDRYEMEPLGGPVHLALDLIEIHNL